MGGITEEEVRDWMLEQIRNPGELNNKMIEHLKDNGEMLYDLAKDALVVMNEFKDELNHIKDYSKKVAKMADDLEYAGVFYPGEHHACPFCDISKYSSFSHARDCVMKDLKHPFDDCGLSDRVIEIIKRIEAVVKK